MLNASIADANGARLRLIRHVHPPRGLRGLVTFVLEVKGFLCVFAWIFCFLCLAQDVDSNKVPNTKHGKSPNGAGEKVMDFQW